MIARANFIIDGYNKCDMSNKNLFTDQAMVTVKNVKGEAFFVRAYFLFNLAQYFCADYDNSNADEKTAVYLTVLTIILRLILPHIRPARHCAKLTSR